MKNFAQNGFDPVIYTEFMTVLSENMGLTSFLRFAKKLSDGPEIRQDNLEGLWRSARAHMRSEDEARRMMDIVWKQSGEKLKG